MDLKAFIDGVPNFQTLLATDQLILFAWYLHNYRGKASFESADIRTCFYEVHIEPPNVGQYLTRLAAKKPPVLLKDRAGFRLAAVARRDLDAKYGNHPTAVAVTQMLGSLPGKIPDHAEREFLSEALNCYRVGAFRAAVVMAWNLTFFHLVSWLLEDASRMTGFNNAISAKYAAKKLIVNKRDDFDDLKEHEVIEVCRVARLCSKNTIDILREKLTRRNIAAHPSSVTVTQHQADDVITDLVNNVVLSLALKGGASA